MKDKIPTSDGFFAQLGRCGTPDLHFEDRAILTLYMQIDFGGSCQGFGGYRLDRYDKVLKTSKGTASGMDFVIRLLKLFEVDRLEDIKGRAVYALYETDDFHSFIIGLRTPKFDGDKTFLVKDWQREWFPEDKGETQ